MASSVTGLRFWGHNLTSFKLFGSVINVVDDNQPENPPPPPAAAPPLPAGVAPLPPAITDAIRARRGTHPAHVSSKVLTAADLKRRNGRLFVPVKARLLNYLNEEERRKIEELDENKKPQEIEVEVVDSRGDSYGMILKNWPSTKNHLILLKGWLKLVDRDGLHEGDRVELWFFRANNRLGIAVNNVKKA